MSQATHETATSWAPQVIADSTGTWSGNALRFASENEAIEWAQGLFMRWTAVREWRVVPSNDEPNR